MIRPLTIATFLMACGSGLYLYQSKHEVQLLDRTIEKTVHDTGALREQSRLLAAEWTMLNDPERLRQFSDTYLNLKSINPAQFTSLADLGGKLPAPRAEVPAPSPDEAPAALDTLPQPVPEPAPAADEDQVLPVPPVPASRPVPAVAAVARPAETKVAAARPVNVDARPATVADAKPSEPRLSDLRPSDLRPSDQRPSDQRPSDQRAPPRVAEARPDVRTSAPPPRPIVLAAPRPQPVNAAPVSAPPANTPPANVQANNRPAPFRPAAAPVAAPSAPPPPYGGSLLGMAHGSMPPAPRPTPVNATYAN